MLVDGSRVEMIRDSGCFAVAVECLCHQWHTGEGGAGVGFLTIDFLSLHVTVRGHGHAPHTDTAASEGLRAGGRMSHSAAWSFCLCGHCGVHTVMRSPDLTFPNSCPMAK